MDLWFSGVSGSLLTKASRYFQKPQVLEIGDKLANRNAGLLERQTQRWQNTGERFNGLIIERIKTVWGLKLARSGQSKLREQQGIPMMMMR